MSDSLITDSSYASMSDVTESSEDRRGTLSAVIGSDRGRCPRDRSVEETTSISFSVRSHLPTLLGGLPAAPRENSNVAAVNPEPEAIGVKPKAPEVADVVMSPPSAMVPCLLYTSPSPRD